MIPLRRQGFPWSHIISLSIGCTTQCTSQECNDCQDNQLTYPIVVQPCICHDAPEITKNGDSSKPGLLDHSATTLILERPISKVQYTTLIQYIHSTYTAYIDWIHIEYIHLYELLALFFHLFNLGLLPTYKVYICSCPGMVTRQRKLSLYCGTVAGRCGDIRSCWVPVSETCWYLAATRYDWQAMCPKNTIPDHQQSWQPCKAMHAMLAGKWCESNIRG